MTFAPSWMGGFPGFQYQGLLGADDQSYLRNQGMLNLGASLLAASGPSTQKTSFGQALGQGLLNQQQYQGQAMQNLLQQRLIKTKLDEAEAEKRRQAQLSSLIGARGAVKDFGVPQVGEMGESLPQTQLQPGTGLLGGLERNDPNALRDFYANLSGLGGTNTQLGVAGLASLAKPQDTEFIKNAEAAGIKRGTPEFANLLNDKLKSSGRGEYYVPIQTAEGVKSFDSRTGNIVDPITKRPITGKPVVGSSSDPRLQAEITGAKKTAEVKAGARAEAEVNLGSTLDEIQKFRGEINGLLKSPGFDVVYGLSRPLAFIPDSSGADSEARRNQLEAASFGISIQKMRGLGQLSDAEGKRVTAAYTRATDTRQSATAAREAWKEVLDTLEIAEKRAKQKAGQQQQDDQGDPLGIRR